MCVDVINEFAKFVNVYTISYSNAISQEIRKKGISYEQSIVIKSCMLKSGNLQCY